MTVAEERLLWSLFLSGVMPEHPQDMIYRWGVDDTCSSNSD
eukprot:CAMPEP_0183314482 /NCGR_PEP_ID=MMETSP0160_2-20130417/48603_1 /TAXON_ID=2839 ORGANISM="Odontella Sinensis, Strain Grunow 1884" /NCGR_SAMPLE_ID=MMETSP0160_2 /ASSEMBLY_ACC=CAM_ASM_000250 /LENGTH=40 /DNA_ID= /DNA_START= /DNA_END= /DNA_ORIENTATION=